MEKRMLFKNNLSKLSKTDQQILFYVEENLDELSSLSIEELADRTFTSRTTISRFVRKLGFNTYSEFKMRVADYCKQKQVGSSSELIEKIKNVKFFNNEGSIDYLTNMMIEANRVYLIGSFSLKSLCTFSRYKFNYYDNKIHGPANDYEVRLIINSIIEPLNENDLAIFFSYSGMTETIVEQAVQFKRMGCRVVAVTNTKVNKLQSMSDYHVCFQDDEIYDDNNRLVASGLPHLYFLEVLYYNYISLIKERNERK